MAMAINNATTTQNVSGASNQNAQVHRHHHHHQQQQQQVQNQPAQTNPKQTAAATGKNVDFKA